MPMNQTLNSVDADLLRSIPPNTTSGPRWHVVDGNGCMMAAFHTRRAAYVYAGAAGCGQVKDCRKAAR